VDKTQRNFRLTIDAINGQKLTVTPPFTIEFDITRNILSSANVSSIKIYNLSENNRNSIYKDKNNFALYRAVQLNAGYGDILPVIFKGNVSHSWSVREGTNFISYIEAYDGGFAFVNSDVASSYPAGTPQRVIYEDMISKLGPTVSPGVIGNYGDSSSRGSSYQGNPADLITQLTGGAFFIDNEKAYVLKNEEVLQGSIEAISSDSGLLGTPIREETIVHFDMIFEPRLMIGQLLTLDSSTFKIINGAYKVISIKHRGMISDSVCGSAITTVGLLHGPSFIKVS
jgi:hypothetical protein